MTEQTGRHISLLPWTSHNICIVKFID